MRDVLTRRRNRKRLERAYIKMFGALCSSIDASDAGGTTCPSYILVCAYWILEQELDWNPWWSTGALQVPAAEDALLGLTRWLLAGTETLLTGDKDQGRAYAARVVPLASDLDVQLPADVDVDEFYWRVRTVMGDPTAMTSKMIVEDLGGTSGLWRNWVGAQLEGMRENGGRFGSGANCQVHPS
jgi:hypothetical protein